MHYFQQKCPQICTFLLQSVALWDRKFVHCEICIRGLLAGTEISFGERNIIYSEDIVFWCVNLALFSICLYIKLPIYIGINMFRIIIDDYIHVPLSNGSHRQTITFDYQRWVKAETKNWPDHHINFWVYYSATSIIWEVLAKRKDTGNVWSGGKSI